MKPSVRNKLCGKIVDVQQAAPTTAHVRIDIGGQVVTAAITNEFYGRAQARVRSNRLCGDQGERRDGRHRLD